MRPGSRPREATRSRLRAHAASSSGVSGSPCAQVAEQQEDVEHAHRLRGDADRQERVEVHEPHLDVFDAALAQRMQWPLALEDAALRADGAVELVLDLQQRGCQLAVLVADAHPDRLVGRMHEREARLERRAVALEAVVAHRQRRLRIALVAQAAHPQRRRVRQVVRVGGEARERMLAPLEEARAHRGRRAEEIQQQPRMPAEVADQREIRLVARVLGEREVVVDARDRLHAPAVPIRQAGAVHGLRAPEVGGAVASERNLVLARQLARHAAGPQELVADRAIDRLVDLRQLAHARLRQRDARP